MNILRRAWDAIADPSRQRATRAAKELVRARLAARAPSLADIMLHADDPLSSCEERWRDALARLADAIGVDVTQLPFDERLVDLLTVSPEELEEAHRNALWPNGGARRYDPFAYDVFYVVERLPRAREVFEGRGSSGDKKNEEEWIDAIMEMSVRDVIQRFT